MTKESALAIMANSPIAYHPQSKIIGEGRGYPPVGLVPPTEIIGNDSPSKGGWAVPVFIIGTLALIFGVLPALRGTSIRQAWRESA